VIVSKVIGRSQVIRPPMSPRPNAFLRPGYRAGGVHRQHDTTLVIAASRPQRPNLGFLTRGRGVMVHHRNCTSIVHSEDRAVDQSRGRQPAHVSVTIKIAAYDRGGLLRGVARRRRRSVNMSSVDVTAALRHLQRHWKSRTAQLSK
jgi:hypothetical protein